MNIVEKAKAAVSAVKVAQALDAIAGGLCPISNQVRDMPVVVCMMLG